MRKASPKSKPFKISSRAIRQYEQGELVPLSYVTIKRENPAYARFIREQTKEYRFSPFGSAAAFYEGARDFYSLWRAHCRAKRTPVSAISPATVEVLRRDMQQGAQGEVIPIRRQLMSSYNPGLRFFSQDPELSKVFDRRTRKRFRPNRGRIQFIEEVAYRTGFVDSWDVFSREYERQQLEREFSS